MHQPRASAAAGHTTPSAPRPQDSTYHIGLPHARPGERVEHGEGTVGPASGDRGTSESLVRPCQRSGPAGAAHTESGCTDQGHAWHPHPRLTHACSSSPGTSPAQTLEPSTGAARTPGSSGLGRQEENAQGLRLNCVTHIRGCEALRGSPESLRKSGELSFHWRF